MLAFNHKQIFNCKWLSEIYNLPKINENNNWVAPRAISNTIHFHPMYITSSSNVYFKQLMGCQTYDGKKTRATNKQAPDDTLQELYVEFRVSCKNLQLADTCNQYPEVVYVYYCCVIYVIILFKNSVAHYVNL